MEDIIEILKIAKNYTAQIKSIEIYYEETCVGVRPKIKIEYYENN